MMDSFLTDYSTEKENSYGQMESFMKGNSLIIELQEKEIINGLMVAHIKER